MHFPQGPEKNVIFYAIHFLYVLQKKSWNKLCLRPHDTYCMFRMFFSQVNNKKIFWGGWRTPWIHFDFCQLYFILHFTFPMKYYDIMFMIIVFRLSNDELVCCLFCLYQGISHGMCMTPRLGEGGWFFIFDCSSLFCFLLIEFHCFFSISYIVLACYVYYYCILFGFNTLFFCFFAGFLLFSSKGSVKACDSSLGSFCYSPVYFLSHVHLHYAYYYYDYVVIGVLAEALLVYRNSLLNRLTAV